MNVRNKRKNRKLIEQYRRHIDLLNSLLHASVSKWMSRYGFLICWCIPYCCCCCNCKSVWKRWQQIGGDRFCKQKNNATKKTEKVVFPYFILAIYCSKRTMHIRFIRFSIDFNSLWGKWLNAFSKNWNYSRQISLCHRHLKRNFIEWTTFMHCVLYLWVQCALTEKEPAEIHIHRTDEAH